jgi:L-lactate dehydrogenase complex protein LldE
VRIALFTTCLADTVAPQVAIAVVTVLEGLGHTVEVPPAQTCCGQMHLNAGYASDAGKLGLRWVRTFASYDVVVTPSASCAGMVRHMYPSQLGVDSPPVHEFTELLVDVLGVIDVGARLAARATYHPTCHSLRMLRLGDRPTQLLKAVADLELVELPAADQCCGFGGTFAVKNEAVSAAMASDKVDAVEAAEAEVLVTVDASCLTHLDGTMRRRGSRIRSMHLAEVLASR